LITRAKYVLAGREALARDASSWEELPGGDRAALEAVLEPLVTAMTFQDERRLLGRIRGNAGYEAAFTARGPADRCGRSLRELDLKSRTFRYPLSYLVYSPAFGSLPPLARRYVYGRLIEMLGAPSGDDAIDGARTAALDILAATLPEFASFARERRALDDAREPSASNASCSAA
jgi:hypothetical protein